MQSWLEYDLASAMIDCCNGTSKQKIEIQKAIFKSGITEWNFRSGSGFVRNHRNLSFCTLVQETARSRSHTNEGAKFSRVHAETFQTNLCTPQYWVQEIVKMCLNSRTCANLLESLHSC